MNHRHIERLKSILIIVLVLTSVIQVGILWGQQNHRLPTSILTAFFGGEESTVSDKTVRRKVFLPFKIVLSNGSSSHWLVESDNPLYDSLWDKGAETLEGIVKGKYKKSGVLALQDWRDITSRSGLTYSFKSRLNPSLLGWFLDAGQGTDTPAVQKMKIIPGLGGGVSEIYINDGAGSIHKYTANDLFTGNSFRNLLDAFVNAREGTYREFTAMVDTNLDRALGAEPDVIFTVKAPRFWTYDTLNAQVPRTVMDERLLAEVLLGKDEERYNKSVTGGAVQFNTTYNLYIVSSNGIFEYRYLQSPSASDKGTIGDALVTAYAFIEKVKDLLNQDTEIYLSGIDESNAGYYSFKFDYRTAGGKPVYIKKEVPAGSNVAVSSGSAITAVQNGVSNRVNAVTINASSRRVLKCDWVLRDFDVAGSGSYNDRYMEIMSNVSENNKPEDIRDINIGYIMDMPQQGDRVKNLVLKPSLVIEEGDIGNLKFAELLRRPGAD